MKSKNNLISLALLIILGLFSFFIKSDVSALLFIMLPLVLVGVNVIMNKNNKATKVGLYSVIVASLIFLFSYGTQYNLEGLGAFIIISVAYIVAVASYITSLFIKDFLVQE